MHVISQENATWQGQVSWLGKKETENFRSLLELIKLIDSAMEENKKQAVCMVTDRYDSERTE